MKDENIVVFMFDDIVYNCYNFRLGVIFNYLNGEDVYYGVFKVFFCY